MALNPRDAAEWLAAEALPSDREFWRVWIREAGPVLGLNAAVITHPPRAGVPSRVLMRWGVPGELPTNLFDGLNQANPLLIQNPVGEVCWFALLLPWDESSADSLIVAGQVSVAVLEEAGESAWRDRALLWATAAGRRRRRRELETLRLRADELATAIELGGLIRAQPSFDGATLEMCNQLAARHGADRVAVGWWRDPYVRLCSINQHNQVESRMTAVGEIEAAMEEALEQDATILWPDFSVSDDSDENRDEPTLGAADISVQHAALARLQGWKGLCSVPMRVGDQVVGVVMWQRADRVFTHDEAERFALVVDVLAPLLADRERRSGSWFRCIKRSAEEWLQRHANLTHPWPKLAAISLALLLAASLLIHVPYRVEAPFKVRPQKQMVFSAPFDGYIETVEVAPGDVVAESGVLFSLEDTSLRLEEGEMLADLSRFNREREQAEAEHDLARMRVAEAQRDQVAARLARLRRQISQTVVKAPFAGTALDDGNLSERLGAPVRQGDALMRFAQLDGLYFELSVPEADAPLIEVNGPVEIAFSGRPDEIETARVVRIEPEASSMESGAFFIVWAEPNGAQPEWWRPGMTGIAKLDTEHRSLFDIFTRRLRDWLQLKLWW